MDFAANVPPGTDSPTDGMTTDKGNATTSLSRPIRPKTRGLPRVCCVCQKKSKKICSRCLCTIYCSVECQTQHWQTGGHKEECQAETTAAKKVLKMLEMKCSVPLPSASDLMYLVCVGGQPNLYRNANGDEYEVCSDSSSLGRVADRLAHADKSIELTDYDRVTGKRARHMEGEPGNILMEMFS
jgi:MYND finger